MKYHEVRFELNPPRQGTAPAMAATRPDYAGNRLLAAMVNQNAFVQFGTLAAFKNKRNGEVLREALNALFDSRGPPRIA